VIKAVKRASPEINPNSNQAIPNNQVIIINVPPGTSCPVIESVKGSDFCLL
jgi:MinD superfamily P-loop ATPase